MAPRLYRWLLGLYPRPFRREFGAEMEQVFRARLHRARSEGVRWQLPVLLAREILNVTASAMRERLARPVGPIQQTKPRADNMLETVERDIRYAVRVLLRAPAFTAIVIGTLALGIGATTAIFSVVNTVLLTPPAFESPEELVMVWEQNFPRSRARNVVNPQNFTNWRERNGVFQEMAAMFTRSQNLTGLGEPRRIRVSMVTTELFGLLGVNPTLGRSFAPGEMEPGNNRVVLLDHGFWQREFGADPDVLGSTVSIQEESYEIIGVMPLGFAFPERTDLWTPMSLGDMWRSSGGRFHNAIARLKPGMTLEQAQADMDAIAAQLVDERPDFNTGYGVNLVPLHEQMVGDVRQALWVLLGAVGFVLLIACANVANLLLGRGVARGKEIAIRAALGAGRGRLVRQMLAETVVLTGVSVIVGLGVSYGLLNALQALAPSGIPRLDSIALDGSVLAFTLGVAAVTAGLFGLVPALHVSRSDVQSTLKEGGRTSANTTGSHRLRSLLVVSEIALAMVLLVGAGLLVRSFQRLLEVDLGFDAGNVLSAEVQLPGARYSTGPEVIRFFDDVIDRLESLPQVVSASAVNFLPLDGLGAATSFTADDRSPPPAGEAPVADVRAVHHNYFNTMRMTVLRGRVFDGHESPDAELFPIVIGQSTAELMWPDGDPIGKTISMPWGDVLHGEVIGVVADVRHMGLETAGRPKIYWSENQFTYQFMSFVVRTNGDPMQLAAVVKEQVWAVDPNLPVADIRAMEDRLGASHAQRRFNMLLLGVFASVALVLACVGIYGVISYAVTQRTHELGLRVALGAQPGDVFRMVVGKGVALTLAAVGIGVVAAVGLTRTMTNLLFQVNALDPVTIGGVAVLLTSVALAASWVPARRATKVDPMVALRNE